jgi:exosome complex component RRP40
MAAETPPARAVEQEGEIVYPGDRITFGSSAPPLIMLGVGVLREEGRVVASKAGILRFDTAANRLAVETEQWRYVPAVDDHVVGVVVEKLSEELRVDLGSSSTAGLPVLAFDGATRKNRPNLQVGSLVFARVVLAHKDMEPELSCAAPAGVASKDWVTGQSLFGELKGGTVVHVSLGAARSLAADDRPGGELLARIGEHMPFEAAVGANGRVWINAGTVGELIALRSAIVTAMAAPVSEHGAIVEHAIRERARTR